MDQELISQTALDQMVSSDQTQLIKAAVPYLPPSARQIISLYTKLEELSNTMALFSSERADMQICENTAADPVEMLQDIRRFSYGKSRQKVDQLTNCLLYTSSSIPYPFSSRISFVRSRGNP